MTNVDTSRLSRIESVTTIRRRESLNEEIVEKKKNISLAVSGLKKPAFGVTVYLIRDDDDDGKVVVGGRGWGA